MNVEMSHVTLTTSTWGTVPHLEANTSRGHPYTQVLAVPEIFQAVQDSKMRHVT